MVRAVFFDVGETLVSEDGLWHAWADWYGVPALTFLGALGAVIERGESHLSVFSYFDPSFSLEETEAARAAAGRSYGLSAADLYDDAVPCLRALKEAGFLVGVAGNQPPHVSETLVASLGLDLDVVASSAAWGVEKPDPAFFARVCASVDLPPSSVAYVGDRVDNDVRPAALAGLVPVLLRRGPWGYVQSRWPDARLAAATLSTLSEVADFFVSGPR